MNENEYRIAGYRFTDARDYKEAKRESETVEYIRANTDLTDRNKTLKLYHKLVERKTLKTIIGYSFLCELREKIISEGMVSSDNLPDIPIQREEKQIKVYDNVLEHEQEERHLQLIEDYRIKLRNSRIISIFLTVIILAMIAITVFSDRSMYSIYENKVIDKYEAWQTELDAREAALDQKEAALSGGQE